ncbi:substrate import-associated zinc metallohydrolase lipoprotein [Parasegetibacter sp. NRK P23]|uniref:substrate import-associated zinc metallohydrolase lipoprotein n=1 Tax=Parasegetibacter sp. NRK P23 TaxID=2942999 RepID=UPI002042C70F|nr:substrate import-associated zinc metallohydrolase lipoprotein [Parasegetibacter sp. NRK P23]MCM5527718.1 putative zinc-binding metallopeptidase [Parasegetibacter sp. NRK P23]
MKLKNIIATSLSGLLLLNTWSCRKSETLNVDMSQYNVDSPVKTELDNWIMTTLTNPYNIQLVYRFERNLTDPGRDVAPIKLEKVKPTVEAILNIFLKTYEKVAGPAFIKTYTPKQFVLYGSPSYNSNGTITLGTADGGRRVVLYELNDLDFTEPQQVSRKMRTIHHEFTHILNQIVAIPPEFQQITKGEYDEDWTNAANTAEIAQSMGFVSRYARSVHTEDFAEVTAHLLVEGQLWYDGYARAAGAAAQAKLKRKEAMVVDYFKQFFNINFRELQYEVAKVLREIYGDNSNNFLVALRNARITKPLVVNFSDDLHTTFGKSAKFEQVWQATKTALGANNRTPAYFQIAFLSATEMQLQCFYTNASGTSYTAWYDFTMNATSGGDITFQYIDKAIDVAEYNNGRNSQVLAGFAPLRDYFTTKTFNGSWLPKEPEFPVFANYLKYGALVVKGESDNFIYGKF